MDQALLQSADVEAQGPPQSPPQSPPQTPAVGDASTLSVTLELRNVSYTVGDTGILHDVSVRFEPGQLSCLQGESGAGKTTIFNVLLANACGRVDGDVLVNGMPPPRHLKSVVKLVPQEDVLMTAFTVRETLFYQSLLVLPQAWTAAQREARIAEVVASLSLEKCIDTRIGTVEERGISGGQRKRLSIAMDLLSNPPVLILDEPTSGLDSKTAEDVVHILRRLADDGKTKRAIIASIHQPSFRIFSLFDSLVLLTNGRVAFRGAVTDAEAFFAGNGHPTPPKENPADHYMRVLQEDGEGRRLADAFRAASAPTPLSLADDALESLTSETAADSASSASTASNASSYEGAGADADAGDEAGGSRSGWRARCGALCSLCPWGRRAAGKRLAAERFDLLGSPMQRRYDALVHVPRYPVSQWRQFQVLLRRANYDSVRDPNKLGRTLALKLGVGLLVGTVWWRVSAPARIEKIFPMEGAMFVLVMNSIIDTLASTIIVFPTTRACLIREYNNGVYALAPYYAGLMCSLFLEAVVCVLVMTVPVYAMVGLQAVPSKVIIFMTVMVLCTSIGNALGVVVGATSRDLMEAQNKLMPCMAPLTLFSGYVIPYGQLAAPFKFFYWISFFQYAISALQLNQFTGLDIEFKVDGYEFPITGDVILKRFLHLDPATHHVIVYLAALLTYAIVITFLGYFVIKRALTKKTG